MDVQIDSYRGGRDEDVARLILDIQNQEAGLNLTRADQPDLSDIAAAYSNGGFWIARDGETIVGTIGLSALGTSGVLKRFFVDPAYRGVPGVSGALYAEALAGARRAGLTALFLDTPSIATRAQSFYARAGFEPIDVEDLPGGYLVPGHDSVFLRLDLSSSRISSTL